MKRLGILISGRGSNFEGFASADGASWASLGSTSVPMNAQIEVGLAPLTLFDAEHDLVQPARAFATGRALAARLAAEELGDAPRRPHHAGRLVHGHDRT